MKLLPVLFFCNSIAAFVAIGQDHKKVLVGTDSFYVHLYLPTYTVFAEFSNWEEDYWNENLPDGNWVIFYEDSVTVAQIGRFKNFKKQGLFTYYNQYGRKQSEVTYQDGQVLLYKSFYLNGNLSYQTSYANNKEIKQSWYNTGILESYITDKRIIYFFPNGIVRLRKKYTNGKLDGDGAVALFNEKGRLIFSGNWEEGKPQEGFLSRKGRKTKLVHYEDLPKSIVRQLELDHSF